MENDIEDQMEEFLPADVYSIIEAALSKNKTMPLTVIETSIFEFLHKRLSNYMDNPDIVYMLSELRKDMIMGFSSMSASNLHNICSYCKKCEGLDEGAVTPVWNVTDPDLMIILENPVVLKQNRDYISTVLKNCGFKSNRCMITFLTRCPMYSKDLGPQHIANCTPYLHTEINSVQPKLIVPLGAKVWGSLTGDLSRKMSDIENNLIWFGLYPMIPGMSLNWYSKLKEQQTNNDYPDRLFQLFSAAHSFLYSSNTELQLGRDATI